MNLAELTLQELNVLTTSELAVMGSFYDAAPATSLVTNRLFNHGRTLLMNVDGSLGVANDYPGDELIPVGFKKLRLPTYLQQIRMRLFGSSPDRAMLNYRLKQFMPLLHVTELEQYLLDLDSRITYATTDYELVLKETFSPRVAQFSGAPARLSILGDQAVPDSTGRLAYEFSVDVLLGNTIQVYRYTPPVTQRIFDLTLTNGISYEYPLEGTGYRFRVNTTNPAAQWTVRGFLRPQWTLGQIVKLLESTGETVMVELFGIGHAEPWETFRNLWYDHTDLPYRLGGLLMAVIYRTEEVRKRGSQ